MGLGSSSSQGRVFSFQRPVGSRRPPRASDFRRHSARERDWAGLRPWRRLHVGSSRRFQRHLALEEGRSYEEGARLRRLVEACPICPGAGGLKSSFRRSRPRAGGLEEIPRTSDLCAGDAGSRGSWQSGPRSGGGGSGARTSVFAVWVPRDRSSRYFWWWWQAMAAAPEELRKDLEEVKELLGKATRKRIRDILTAEKSKLETEIKHKTTKQKGQEKGETIDEKPAAVVAPISVGYTVKINNYGWDQSDKYVKIYITLNGVQQVPTENVQVQFKERSFEVLVKNLNGKNYSMTVNNLLKPISVEGSSRKIKTDTVLVLCKKKQEQKWDYLTQVEKECKEKEKSSFDNDTDPSEGLMNVLKKIYEDGDDEMKRTINKAWVESREKQAKGESEF
ncbi:calcyclin-binding protein [Dromiciops gliroides]|uniref:calcyclin-binding protein n=1 Tax=Dromiciops gliroides TaxID=33562 RepID=UPI001CC42C8E|nr:calcyclin-binding protein [Dromiciops gliroides]